MKASTKRELSASHIVRTHLEQEISQGSLLPGDPLDEDELARRFGMSRTPVREAMLHLSARGLVTIAPRSGIYVSRLSIPELAFLAELMAELEGACAKLAARRLSIAESEALKCVHESSAALVQASDPIGYARCNSEFHEILYRACRNPALADEIVHIRRRVQVYRQTNFQSLGRMNRSFDEHRRILAAILSGDAALAGHEMCEHITIGGRDFTEFLATAQPSLLHAQADYPGRQVSEQRRAAAKSAAESLPQKQTTASKLG